MKKCQAVKKDGNPCTANGAHIMMVWALGMVAYPEGNLPALYANHGWVLQAINACGAHRNKLVGGKPINIIPIMGSNQASSTEVPTQPKEGIMNKTKAPLGCYCQGTGIDPVFEAPCKCVSDVETSSSATPAQLRYLAALIGQVKWEVKISDNSKSDASQAIDLLKEVVALQRIIESSGIEDSQKSKIMAKLAAGTTKLWIKAEANKILSKALVVKIQQVMKVNLSWADSRVETILLLQSILQLVQAIKAKKQLLTNEQIEYLREQINLKPTNGWVLAKVDKLNRLS